jgi:two-component system, NarL family, response regulator DesR
MIRVLLADGALAERLRCEPDFEVHGGCPDGLAALCAARSLRPDVIVADAEMPRLSGLELAQRVCEGGLTCRVLIVTSCARAGYLRHALDAGVAGYLLKDAPAGELAEAVRKVHAGGRAFDPQLAVGAWTEADSLNERERQVLNLAGGGVSSTDIATQLGLSHGAVRNYLAEALGKLKSADCAEACRLARQKGWL